MKYSLGVYIVVIPPLKGCDKLRLELSLKVGSE